MSRTNQSPFYSGLEGSLWVIEGGEWMKVAAVKNWAFTQNQTVLDTTTLGDTDRTLIDGVRSLSGSCSLFYYNFDRSPEEDTGAGRILQKILKPFSITGKTGPKGQVWTGDDYRGGSIGDTGNRSTRMAFRLSTEKDPSKVNTIGDSVTERFLWLNAWITSFQMTASVGEVLSCEVTFEADGTALVNEYSDYSTND